MASGIILRSLLIVPYGIEIEVNVIVSSPVPAFNRTLWN